MLRLPSPSVRIERRGATLFLESGHPLPPPARCLGDLLVAWAQRAPERTWLAERATDGWRTVSYAEGLAAARSIGSALLERGASATRPVMMLADNGVDHALAMMGALHAGVPFAPVSPAYGFASTDFGRLREVFALLRPRVLITPDAARAARALDALRGEPGGLSDVVVIDTPTAFAQLRATPPSADLDRAFAAITPDTIAKVLFTSGSTGTPKGVVNTHRMLCSNQAAIATLWPFLGDEPPITVDWLPWSHTFGGNHNFNMVLHNGGTLYVDGGRPAPGLIEQTVANLREIAPTLYFNVPRGFDLLLPHLESDDALRARFFSRVRTIFYAAAALAPSTRARLEACARQAGRDDVFFATAWGSTETAPMATSAYFPTTTPALIGLPAPGTTIALAPVDDKLECRVRGPNVTPGYWAPGGRVVPPALDVDGFLPTGDAVRLDDPAHPERGLVFEGRLGENFKLSSGTWVAVGMLRLAVVEACAPLVQDAVIAGHDREALGALLFPTPALLALDPRARHDRLRAALAAHNVRMPASSTRITRARVLTSPPSLDAGETTDKGYLNQRRVLAVRAAEVSRLFAAPVLADDAIEVG